MRRAPNLNFKFTVYTWARTSLKTISLQLITETNTDDSTLTKTKLHYHVSRFVSDQLKLIIN
jgi:hypothetical protein